MKKINLQFIDPRRQDFNFSFIHKSKFLSARPHLNRIKTQQNSNSNEKFKKYKYFQSLTSFGKIRIQDEEISDCDKLQIRNKETTSNNFQRSEGILTKPPQYLELFMKEIKRQKIQKMKKQKSRSVQCSQKLIIKQELTDEKQIQVEGSGAIKYSSKKNKQQLKIIKIQSLLDIYKKDREQKQQNKQKIQDQLKQEKLYQCGEQKLSLFQGKKTRALQKRNLSVINHPIPFPITPLRTKHIRQPCLRVFSQSKEKQQICNRTTYSSKILYLNKNNDRDLDKNICNKINKKLFKYIRLHSKNQI